MLFNSQASETFDYYYNMLRCDDSPDESIMSGRSGRTGASGRTGGNESYFDEEYEDGEYADEDHFDQFDPGRRQDPFDLPSPYERGRAQRAANQNRLPKRRGSSAGRQSAGVGAGVGGLRRHNSSVGGRDGFGMTNDRDRNYGSLRKSKDHHRSNPQLSNIPFEPNRSRDLLSPPGSERGDYRENRSRDFDNYKRGINRNLDIGREFDRRMPKRSGSAMDLRGLDRGLDTGSRGRLDFDRALDRNLDRRDRHDRNHHRDDRAQRQRDDSHSRSMKNLSRISQSIRDIRGTSEEDLELINA